LGETRSDYTIPRLLEVLDGDHHENSMIFEAIKALGCTGKESEVTVAHLLTVITDQKKAPFICDLAVEILWKLDEKAGLPGMLDLIEKANHAYEPDWNTRNWAIREIIRTQNEAAISELFNTLKGRSTVESAAKWLPKDFLESGVTIPSLLHLIEHPDPYIRLNAATALVKLDSKSKAATSTFLDLLKEQNSNIYIHAVKELAKLGNTAVIPILVKALEDKNWHYITEILERWNNEVTIPILVKTVAIPVLIKVLERKEFRHYRHFRTAKALANLGSNVGMQELLSLGKMLGSNSSVRESVLGLKAVEALEDLGSEESIQALLTIFLGSVHEKYDVNIHGRVINALNNTLKELENQIGAKSVLLDILRSRDDIPRDEKIEVISIFGNESVVPELLNAL